MSDIQPAHIAFLAIPAHGHINPGLGLVAELVARGHRVTYPVPEEFVPHVREAGGEPVVCDTLLPTERNPSAWSPDPSEAIAVFVQEAELIVPTLLEHYADDQPDLVLFDTASAHGAILAKKWGVPEVAVSASHVPFEGFEEAMGWGKNTEVAKLFERLGELPAKYGVEGDLETLRNAGTWIAALPRGFQCKPETAPPGTTFVGPMLTGRAHQGSWEPPNERPVLLISLGSGFNDRPSFYRNCVAAFTDSDWHVVLCVGRMVDPAELGELPVNVEVHQWIPQWAILQHATAFVTHAGMGGTMEGLSAGVPMVAVPQAGDQFPNATRIEELGCGVQLLTEDATPEVLRAAVERVAGDPRMKENLARMRAEIEACGGAREAADLVEQQLRPGDERSAGASAAHR